MPATGDLLFADELSPLPREAAGGGYLCLPFSLPNFASCRTSRQGSAAESQRTCQEHRPRPQSRNVPSWTTLNRYLCSFFSRMSKCRQGLQRRLSIEASAAGGRSDVPARGQDSSFRRLTFAYEQCIMFLSSMRHNIRGPTRPECLATSEFGTAPRGGHLRKGVRREQMSEMCSRTRASRGQVLPGVRRACVR